AISVLISLLIKWTSSLDMEVKRRTKELDESNKQLALANEQLTMHDKMQKEFINVAAHELKTPIQPIISLAEHLKNSRKLDLRERGIHDMPGEVPLQKQRQQDELVEVIIRNARRLRRLADNILDVTKIETQSLLIKKEPFDLNKLVINIITDFRSHIARENKNITLEFISNGSLAENGFTDEIFVDADKDRISQVILNLLTNAVKSTKAGTITVIVGRSKEHVLSNDGKSQEEVVVTVKDTGSGVDPEILPRLFTKFATKSQSGTGLGLFISKNIIESHGGKIWLGDSNRLSDNKDVNDNNGAMFSFSLPMISPKQLKLKSPR
ncbi:MAG TPA: HAMP domain-containing sensor histidine kinase, partial [Nitrososphaeraceae archaeon]|nr:HAMP domain-containing sensor histidine kinase [Nitrososphaeraceae archaeon]